MRGLLADTAERLDAWRRHCALDPRGPLARPGGQRHTARAVLYPGRERRPPLRAIDAAACALMAARPPDQDIRRAGAPYLLRWHLERNDERCVYLHRFVGDDPDCGPHDHPWDSASLLIAGRQVERWLPAGGVPGRLYRRTLGAGDVLYRPAAHAHQLTLPPGREALTLFVTGPRVRAWGFWVQRAAYPAPRTFERHPPELEEAS